MRDVEMSPGVVSNFNFEYQLVMHVKRCKLKLTIFTIYLEKCNFLQTTPNICNLYTKSKLVKCWSIIPSPYLKNHLHLAGKWPKSHRFTVEPRRKSCDSPKIMGMDGLVLELWVKKWSWLENLLKMAEKWKKNRRGYTSSRTTCNLRCSPSGDEISVVGLSTVTLPPGLTRARWLGLDDDEKWQAVDKEDDE